MAQFAIDIPDSHVGRVVEAMCSVCGYSDSIDNPNFDGSIPESEANPRAIPNPEARGQFANRKVREFLIENVRAHETRLAADAARDALRVFLLLLFLLFVCNSFSMPQPIIPQGILQFVLDRVWSFSLHLVGQSQCPPSSYHHHLSNLCKSTVHSCA